MRALRSASFAVAASLFLAGCATATEDIVIGSTPRNAIVRVDGKVVGTTPLTVALTRKGRHEIRIERDGYETYVTRLARKVRVMYWLNLASPFGEGLIVDAVSGRMFNLTPNRIFAALAPQDTAAGRTLDAPSIIPVPTPDSARDPGRLVRPQ